MTRRTDEPCYNCAAPNAETRDHVFSRSWFAPPRPSNLPTVPACGPCQRSFWRDETYFRDLVVSGAYGHPLARTIWDGAVKRSFEKDDTGRADLERGLRRAEVRTAEGVFLGTVVGVDGDLDRMGTVLKKVVKGLFYVETGSVMPSDVSWSFEQISPLTAALSEVTRDLLADFPKKSLGTEVEHRYGIAPLDPRLTIAWLGFYRTAMFVAATFPDGLGPYDEAVDTPVGVST